jgi:stage II sporulation protein D
MDKTQPDSSPITIQPAASDDEAACIAAAIEAYLLAEQTDIAVANAADNAPWAVAARIEAAAVSTNVSRDQAASAKGKSLWHGRLFSIASLLTSATLLGSLAGAPALALDSVEGALESSSDEASQLAYGKSSAPSVAPPIGQTGRNRATIYNGAPAGSIRVCLATGTQKVDLDFPDGGSIYTVAGGNLVARISPQSSFSLNLAKAAGGAAISFAPKSARDSISAASNITRASFVPSTGSMFSPKQLNLPFKSKASETAEYAQDSSQSPSQSQSQSQSQFQSQSQSGINASQGYIAVPDAPADGDAALVGVSGKLYRGALILKPVNNDSAIAVINVLKLEDYLLSVVPSEVPSLWHKEALKAQAIAARSYAVANLGKHGKEGYDVKATVDDQVYRGVIAEAAETNAAVAETSGLVLKNNNKVISAFFHSTSGGSTEVAENVWGKPLPYLKSVVDYDDASPQFNWKKTVSSAALAKLLADDTAVKPAAGQPLLGVLVIGRHPGDSKRVKDVLLVGPGSARLVGGTELRRLFNLPSTQFSLFQSDNSYIFSGRGYGHGLGLSQWGAKALADNGYNAEQILSYYYKDVTIEPLAQDGAI